MHPLALILALLSAVVHAGWNALVKRSGNHLLFIWLQFLVGGLVALPWGIAQLWQGIPQPALGLLPCSMLAHAVYTYCLAASYHHGDLSLAYPFSRGFGLALVPLAALLLLGERVSLLGGLGIGAITLGVFWIGFSAARRGSGIFILKRQVFWMLLCGSAIAAYSLIDHTAVPHVSPLGWLSLILLGCCTLLAPFVLRDAAQLGRVWRGNWRYIVGAGLASSLGYTLVLYAFRLSKTGYVVAARESSILFAVLIGSYLLREQQVRPRLLGGAAIVVGLILLAFAQ